MPQFDVVDRRDPERGEVNAAGSSVIQGSKPDAISIAVVDDHPLALVGFRALIEATRDLEIVAEASNLEAALGSIKAAHPRIVVICVPMPGLSLAEFTPLCRDLRLESEVIAVTWRTDTDVLAELLQSGAQGYLLKRSAPAELIRAIRAVMSGSTFVDPAIASRLLLPSSPACDASSAALTERELPVLKLMVRGFSSKEIAAEMTLSIKTVHTYKMRAMKKLRLRTRADVVRYGTARGWLDEM
jgi:DNA-binding NarL/FixJ family response regulator